MNDVIDLKLDIRKASLTTIRSSPTKLEGSPSTSRKPLYSPVRAEFPAFTSQKLTWTPITRCSFLSGRDSTLSGGDSTFSTNSIGGRDSAFSNHSSGDSSKESILSRESLLARASTAGWESVPRVSATGSLPAGESIPNDESGPIGISKTLRETPALRAVASLLPNDSLFPDKEDSVLQAPASNLVLGDNVVAAEKGTVRESRAPQVGAASEKEDTLIQLVGESIFLRGKTAVREGIPARQRGQRKSFSLPKTTKPSPRVSLASTAKHSPRPSSASYSYPVSALLSSTGSSSSSTRPSHCTNTISGQQPVKTMTKLLSQLDECKAVELEVKAVLEDANQLASKVLRIYPEISSLFDIDITFVFTATRKWVLKRIVDRMLPAFPPALRLHLEIKMGGLENVDKAWQIERLLQLLYFWEKENNEANTKLEEERRLAEEERRLEEEQRTDNYLKSIGIDEQKRGVIAGINSSGSVSHREGRKTSTIGRNSVSSTLKDAASKIITSQKAVSAFGSSAGSSATSSRNVSKTKTSKTKSKTKSGGTTGEKNGENGIDGSGTTEYPILYDALQYVRKALEGLSHGDPQQRQQRIGAMAIERKVKNVILPRYDAAADSFRDEWKNLQETIVSICDDPDGRLSGSKSKGNVIALSSLKSDPEYLACLKSEFLKRMDSESGMWGISFRRNIKAYETTRETLLGRIPTEPYDVTTTDLKSTLILLKNSVTDVERKLQILNENVVENVFKEIRVGISRRDLEQWDWTLEKMLRSKSVSEEDQKKEALIEWDRIETYDWRTFTEGKKNSGSNQRDNETSQNRSQKDKEKTTDRICRTMTLVDGLVHLCCEVRESLKQRILGQDIPCGKVIECLSTFISKITEMSDQLIELLDEEWATDEEKLSIAAPQQNIANAESEEDPITRWNEEFAEIISNCGLDLNFLIQEHVHVFVKRKSYLDLSKIKAISDLKKSKRIRIEHRL